MKKIEQLLMRCFGWLLNRAKLISDMVKAISSLTRAVADLTKAYAMMAKYQEEDRKSIAELYMWQAELAAELSGVPLAQEVLPEKTTVVAKPTPIEAIQQEKKKKLLN